MVDMRMFGLMDKVQKKEEYSSLNSMIEFGKCEALNSQGDFGVKETFGYGGTTKSNEGDPELIFLVTFKEKLSLTGIMIESPEEGFAPKDLYLFAGKDKIDFSDIDSITPTETFKITPSKIMSLKMAKYRQIDCLAIYMKNEESDMIKVNNIQLYGSGGENTDMTQMKNVSM